MATGHRFPDETTTTLLAPDTPSAAATRTPEELAGVVSHFASSDGWLEKVRLRSDRRWYQRLYEGLDYDIWVLSWLPGQSTGFHDHGASSGAFVVATGTLEEHRPGERPRLVQAGEPRAFGADYAHDVRNDSRAPAISIHAYSPPLSEMNRYELDEDGLIPQEGASRKIDTFDEEWRRQSNHVAAQAANASIDQLLSAARARLRRLTPAEAYEAKKKDAVLVDIRPEGQRATEGSIPGAVIVERNVLEWRFDPSSPARLPLATTHDLHVIVFCSEGYTSSLAAAALQDLGIWRATDLIGGFKSWREAGLPLVPPEKG